MRFFAKAALTSYKGKYVHFLTGTFEDGLLVGHRLLSHSTASLASQDPPAGMAPPAAQVGCGEEKRHSAEPPKVSRTRAQRWETNKQLDHTPGLTATLITAGFHKAWLNRALVQWGCTPPQLSHLSGSGTADVMDSHLGGHLGEPAHQWLPVEPPKRTPNLCGWRKPSNRNI